MAELCIGSLMRDKIKYGEISDGTWKSEPLGQAPLTGARCLGRCHRPVKEAATSRPWRWRDCGENIEVAAVALGTSSDLVDLSSRGERSEKTQRWLPRVQRGGSRCSQLFILIFFLEWETTWQQPAPIFLQPFPPLRCPRQYEHASLSSLLH